MRPTTAVADVLERARDVTQPLMRDAVAGLTPSIRDVVSYHIGWTDSEGNPTASGGGKGIRVALATLSAEASWADAAVGAPGGVAVELVHNFSLLHDDLMDGDVERRHRPTAWALWGPSVALLAGDALCTLATDVLLRTASPAAPSAALALCEATAEMIAGQADDLAFEARRAVSVEECMSMSTAKTGALLGCAASIGAILASAPPATVRALRDFGRHLGVAFQATDDLLGIWGDPATTGKPIGNDIRQRKKSMPIVAALAAGDDEAKELDALLFGTRPGPGAPAQAASNGRVPNNRPDGNGLDAEETARVGVASSEGARTEGARTEGARTEGATTGGARSEAARTEGAGARPSRRPEKHAPTLAVPGWASTPSPLTHEEVARATWLVEACGGREWTAARAKAHLDAALGSLERARLSAVPRRALADLAVYVVERES